MIHVFDKSDYLRIVGIKDRILEVLRETQKAEKLFKMCSINYGEYTNIRAESLGRFMALAEQLESAMTKSFSVESQVVDTEINKLVEKEPGQLCENQ